MKKYKLGILFLIITVFVACKEHKSIENVVSIQNEPTSTWQNEIQLNNGNKWVANSATNNSVEKMLQLMETSSPSILESYHEIAFQLNEIKNRIIKSCIMKGEAHDNLHLWLQPLIENINRLSKSQSTEKAAVIMDEIKFSLIEYSTYFK